MATIFSDKITISGKENFDMHYRVYNHELLHERMPLVCAHGIRGSCLDFDILARSISNFSTIAIDVVGRGQSSWLKDWHLYNYNTYCSSCISLLRHLKIKKCNFLGTSMGGIIGMFLASRFPDFVSKLVLNDVGPYMSKKSLSTIVRYMLQAPTFDDLDSARKYLKVSLSNFGIDQEEHWDYALQSHVTPSGTGYVLSGDPEIGTALQSEVESIGNVMNLWDVWSGIQCDVLVLKGEFSHVLTSDILKKMTESKPDIDVLVVKNVGHAPALYTEERIKPVVQWLEKSTINTH